MLPSAVEYARQSIITIGSDQRYGIGLELLEHCARQFDWKLVPEYAIKRKGQADAKLGVEVQFGKYSFMVYNVAAKMTIFRNLGFIDTGIEVVPVKAMADEMSSGVSYFEQFVWDLEKRGKADIDIPVLIFGIDV